MAKKCGIRSVVSYAAVELYIYVCTINKLTSRPMSHAKS
jgi:hypothetical protein